MGRRGALGPSSKLGSGVLGEPGVELSSGPGLNVQAQSQAPAPVQPCSASRRHPGAATWSSSTCKMRWLQLPWGKTAALPVLGGRSPAHGGLHASSHPHGAPASLHKPSGRGCPCPRSCWPPTCTPVPWPVARGSRTCCPRATVLLAAPARSQPPPGETLLGAHILRGAKANICSSWWHHGPAGAPALPCFIATVSAWGRAEAWG